MKRSKLHLQTALLAAWCTATLRAAPESPSIGETAQMRGVSFISTKEFSLSIVVLCFGLALVALLIFFKDKFTEPIWLFKILSLITVLTFSVVVLFGGYSDTQITPVVGLMGTALGYAMGKDDKSTRNNDAK